MFAARLESSVSKLTTHVVWNGISIEGISPRRPQTSCIAKHSENVLKCAVATEFTETLCMERCTPELQRP